MGSPYVPTRLKEVEYILSEAHLKKGKTFIELGCGDGRVVRTAVKDYGIKGIGIDINPLIIWYARLLARLQKTEIGLIVEDIFSADIRNGDYVYVFLMPDILKKIQPLLRKQLKKNAVVISHGFRFLGWEHYLFKTIPHTPFPTYFYRLEE